MPAAYSLVLTNPGRETWTAIRTAEVRGSTPLRSTTDLQGNRALRALREASRQPCCNHSATQIRAPSWDWLGLGGARRDGRDPVRPAFACHSDNVNALSLNTRTTAS